MPLPECAAAKVPCKSLAPSVLVLRQKRNDRTAPEGHGGWSPQAGIRYTRSHIFIYQRLHQGALYRQTAPKRVQRSTIHPI
jgi:hypothetical protein